MRWVEVFYSKTSKVNTTESSCIWVCTIFNAFVLGEIGYHSFCWYWYVLDLLIININTWLVIIFSTVYSAYSMTIRCSSTIGICTYLSVFLPSVINKSCTYIVSRTVPNGQYPKWLVSQMAVFQMALSQMFSVWNG